MGKWVYLRLGIRCSILPIFFLSLVIATLYVNKFEDALLKNKEKDAKKVNFESYLVASISSDIVLLNSMPYIITGVCRDQLDYPKCTEFEIRARPRSGRAPLTSTITLLGAEQYEDEIDMITWYISDENGGEPGEVNFQWERKIYPGSIEFSAEFPDPGKYTIGVCVEFENGDVCKLIRRNYITVREEGEGGDFTSQIIIKDREGLIPLTDWVPLFNFVMGYDPEEPKYRVLESLIYRIRADNRAPEVLQYANVSGPSDTDILEFALFRERYDTTDESKNYDLDPGDILLYKWNADGSPLGNIIINNPNSIDGLTYRINFIGAGTPTNPQFPVVAGPIQENGFEGYSYIVAVRTSATWRSQLTLSCDVLSARMVDEYGQFPVDENGEPLDTYDPNFYDPESPEILEADVGYSSSFTVWDLNGLIYPEQWNEPAFNAWNYPTMLYTPLAEHTRPKWPRFDQLLDVFAGEMLSFRRLLAMEEWRPVIGINLHSTKSIHFDSDDPLIFGSRYYDSRWDNKKPQLREVNIILTDIGADPYGPMGNGGFDPRDGLKKVSTRLNIPLEGTDTAVLQDVVFNGIWVWHDTNRNGKFDPPTPLPNGGVRLNGDYPLRPDVASYTDHLIDWEYIPFPPGGGDPWWKICLRFYGGRRGDPFDEGYVSPVPNNYMGNDNPTGSEYSLDYFVVIRADSGFKDVSLTVPDGKGVMMGADFRCFIEPRWKDTDGNIRGGIYVDSQIPPLGAIYENAPAWQFDPRWGLEEPWWPERTVNELSTKPMKVGIDVHDLVLVYTSDSPYRNETDIFFGNIPINPIHCLGYSSGMYDDPTDFDKWMDPYGYRRNKFLNLHSVSVTKWRDIGILYIPIKDFVITIPYDYTHMKGHYSYETVPFDRSTLSSPDGRSSAYPKPLAQPTLPDYSTWSRNLSPGEYPRAVQWSPEYRRARLLTQKTDICSEHTALLGINLVWSKDPIVNEQLYAPMSVAKITVAFWGPDFSPDILMPLDPNGKDYDSGVLLWEDFDKNGIFFESTLLRTYWENLLPSVGDRIVPLRNLQWRSSPEPIDIDGDGVPDDMNGDGVVDQRDYAWVLTLYPDTSWILPNDDFMQSNIPLADLGCGSLDLSGIKSLLGDSYFDIPSENNAMSPVNLGEGAKQVSLVGNNPGDDLFITVRLSDKAKRFQSFRAVIPATLPSRHESERKAGIQFYPQVNTSNGAYKKLSPEESPVQDFYGHDMIEINIPVQIWDLVNQQQPVVPGGASLAVLGLDISTNRPEDSIYQGAYGVGSDRVFTVQDASFVPNSLVGDYLIDSAYEAYEIVGNSDKQIFLLSGTPRTGPWRIERNPSFLEEVNIELYNEGSTADFNPLNDLLPLNIDQEISGVALYRDNDFDPRNRNGIFDPGVDIPVNLDVPPFYIGQSGEPIKVKFVFSMPGTDDIPYPRDQQPRHIQWIPTSFGDTPASPFYGPDFFVVIRPSDKMRVGTNFRVGIVNWGPNTPTEPDPDTWARLSGEQRNDFTKFREFPWALRGLGFITYFKQPPVNYYLDGYRARADVDNSGVRWVRTHCTKKKRTGVMTAINRPISPTTLLIESTSVSQIPIQILPGQEYPFVIYGKNFGTNPLVKVSNYQVRIIKSSDTSVSVAVSNIPGVIPTEPVILFVKNSTTGEEAWRTDLLTLTSSPVGVVPIVDSVIPNRGTSKDFPVTVKGNRFSPLGKVQVIFGETIMPVLSVSPDGTSISVGFPLGGIPTVGLIDVTVKNLDQGTQYTLAKGFEYVNDAQRPTKKLLFGCGYSKDSRGLGSYLSDFGIVLFIMSILVSYAHIKGSDCCSATLPKRSSHCERKTQ